MYKLSAITRTVGVGAKHAAVSRTTQQVPFPPHHLAHRAYILLYSPSLPVLYPIKIGDKQHIITAASFPSLAWNKIPLPHPPAAK